MIIYRESYGAYNILFRWYGAPWPRAFLLSLPGTLLGVFLFLYAEKYVMTLINHPAAYLVYGSLVTFGVVFRTNLSYSRYWEGCTAIRTMSTKLTDAAVQLLVADEAAEKRDKVEGGLKFRAEFMHLLSLMHSLALQSVRGDDSLSNLVTGEFMEIPEPPPMDAAHVAHWTLIRRKHLYFMLSANEAHFRDYWQCCPLTVLGGVSSAEVEALESSRERVLMVYCWIWRMVAERRLNGGIKLEPPCFNRVCQVLADGLAAYESAFKLASTPFPFPFAQSVAILLHLNIIVAPITMARWCGQAWLVGLLSFLSLFSVFLLEEVAREIEEPFRYDPNDLPSVWYQYKFNAQLVTTFVKSLLPHDSDVLHHIADEHSLRRMLALRNPNLRHGGIDAIIDNHCEKPTATEDLQRGCLTDTVALSDEKAAAGGHGRPNFHHVGNDAVTDALITVSSEDSTAAGVCHAHA